MIIPNKESDKVEFKLILNNAVIETLVAFSNAKGGSVYIGVADNANVIGISLGKETIPQMLYAPSPIRADPYTWNVYVSFFWKFL